jgi:formyltetrahydrofolate-dependent phosphoribosylglycinamide formyltransferase
MPLSPIKLAVLISGSGTTLQNLVDEINGGRLDARITVVVSSRPGLVGLDRAAKAGLKSVVVDRKKFDDVPAFSREIFAHCAGVDLICLAGWLCLLKIPPEFAGKMMNIHPALLPSFGGRGMYGRHVHQAVLDNGCKVSGCTVHFVDDEFDHGPIILQRTCPVEESATPESLAHRVFEEEKIAYPQAIRLFQQGRLSIAARRVRISN